MDYSLFVASPFYVLAALVIVWMVMRELRDPAHLYRRSLMERLHRDAEEHRHHHHHHHHHAA
jgi:ABC-type nickel/cobalt efflux system permease component RcnA